MDKTKRKYCIIMHNRLHRGYIKFEKELSILMRKHRFEFVGSGYDKTNDRRDIEWRMSDG